MPSFSLAGTQAAVTILVTAATLYSQQQPAPPQYVVKVSVAGNVWLLDEGGRLFAQHGESKPQPRVQLVAEDAKPLRWTRPPSALAQHGNQWIVADGTKALYLFSPSGRLARRIALPVRTFDVFVTADQRVWIYDSVPGPSRQRLFSSGDFQTFTPSIAAFEVTTSDTATQLLTLPLLFEPLPKGGLVSVQGIGDPLAVTLTNGRRATFPLAYSRTRGRAALVNTGHNRDMTLYSAPARDLLATSSGEIIVLRNREDVPKAGGGSTVEQGRRADMYSSDGRHIKTATFAQSARWLLRVSNNQLLALTAAGEVIRAPLGTPVPGRIID